MYILWNLLGTKVQRQISFFEFYSRIKACGIIQCVAMIIYITFMWYGSRPGMSSKNMIN